MNRSFTSSLKQTTSLWARHGKMLWVQLYLLFSQLQPSEGITKEGRLTLENTKGWKAGENPSVPFRSGWHSATTSVQLGNWSESAFCPHILCNLFAETEVDDNIFISVSKYRYNKIPFREMRLGFFFFFASMLFFFVCLWLLFFPIIQIDMYMSFIILDSISEIYILLVQKGQKEQDSFLNLLRVEMIYEIES